MILKTIRITDIEIGDRAREDLGDLETLVESIKSHGVIQPIAVEKLERKKTPYRLLAGERRLTAAGLARLETVPARIYIGPLNDIERKSIELEENLRRKALTWKEEVELKKRIHDLQVQIHGEKLIKTSKDDKGQTIADTAELLGTSRTSLGRDIALARALKVAPDLFKDCKTKSDAQKVQQQLQLRLAQELLAKRVSSTGSVSESIANSFIVGDFFEKVKEIPDCSINLVELDPPYGIDLLSLKRDSAALGVEYTDVLEDYEEFIENVLDECVRVMTENSWLICWFSPTPHYNLLFDLLVSKDLQPAKLPGIWTKKGGQTTRPEYNLASCHEMFFYARKGSPTISKPGRSNVFSFPGVQSLKKVHPAEKPLPLMVEILHTFGSPGDRVLVPFAGSGNTILAAWLSKMTAVGFDLSENYRNSFLVKAKTCGLVDEDEKLGE